ncbi:hypothetical protein VPHK479_0067 [Vibrio phage K479]
MMKPRSQQLTLVCRECLNYLGSERNNLVPDCWFNPFELLDMMKLMSLIRTCVITSYSLTTEEDMSYNMVTV